MASYPAGWYTDPVRRFQYRFWNGTQWTNQVSNSGTSGTDPDALDPEMVATPPAPGSQAPGPPQPAAAAMPAVQVSQKSGSGLGVIVGVLVGILLVVIIAVVLIMNSGDDTSTTEPSVTVTTEAPATTVAP
jgi:hypothetical protein